MKKRNLLLVSFMLMLGFLWPAATMAQSYESGRVRIKFTEEGLQSLSKKKASVSASGVVLTGLETVDVLNTAYSATKLTRVFPYAPKFEERHKQYGLHLWYELKVDESANPLSIAQAYQNLDEVSYAEAMPVVLQVQPQVVVDENPLAKSSSATAPFNDPLLSKMWHYENDASGEGWLAEADINVYEAWKSSTGSKDIVVAVVDGGIDIDHPDLEDAMWINEAELNGVDGIDDDGNGYPDDIYGYNFATGSGTIEAHYHGTHVAGIVGAVNNNGVGIAGVAGGSGYGDGVRLMSCQIFTEDGDNAGYAAALIYAADMGAVIAQNSWGWSDPGVYTQSVLDAIDYFIAEAGQYSGSPLDGGIAIFAAGNNGDNDIYYPASYEPVLSVGATGPSNVVTDYSNYADWVDVMVPGGDYDYGEAGGIYSTLTGGKYGYLTGTSMACPHVSGIAALVVSKFANKGMTADELRTQLLTSVHDIYSYNPDFEGLLGTGYMDAAMALVENNSTIVPEKISDLSVTGIAQDFAELSWSMPVDADNGHAAGFDIYWSKTELTAENYTYAATASIYKMFTEAGENVSYTIEDLDATTTYYFAVIPFDRWNNYGALSDVITATTNNGPEIRFESDTLEFTIDVTASAQVSMDANLYNDAEGLLSWQVAARLHDYEVDAYVNKAAYSYPTITNYTPLVDVGLSSAIKAATEVASAPVPNDWEASYKTLGASASIVIGDNDTAVTNSSATRFYVDEEEGFNLTLVRPYLKYDAATGPCIIEIYEGEDLATAQLLEVTEYTYSYTGTYEFSRQITLHNPLFFEEGSYFWVVVHVPSGNLYPFGIAEEEEEDGSDNCYISFNGGTTWTHLAEAIEDDEEEYVFALSAYSLQAPIDDFVTVDPMEGTVEGFGSEELTVSVDGSTVIDGSYIHNLVFLSNDSKNEYYTTALQIDVDGHEPKLSSQKTINFGSVFVDKEKTISVELLNTGYVGFKLEDGDIVSSDETVFSIDDQSSKNIPARGDGYVDITFTPTVDGTFAETITISNADGYSYSFNVYGVASYPAMLEISPLRDTVEGDLIIGDAIADRTVTLSNVGDYPLQYKISKFAPDYEVEGLETPVNNFGYSYTAKRNITAATLTNEGYKEIASNNLVTELKGYDYAKQVDLGFSFPFYDKIFDKVWVHEEGALVFGEEGNFTLKFASGSSILPSRLRDAYFISAFMATADYDNTNCGIYYEKGDGVFRVTFENVGYGSTSPIGQIAIYANGDIDIFYENTGAASSALYYLVGLVNEDNDDVTLISNSDYPIGLGETTAYEKAVFHIQHPGEDMITAVTNPSGVIMPNKSVDLTLSFSTESVNQDFVYQRLPIISNDGYVPIKAHTICANFVGGGKDSVLIEIDTLYFGDVYRTAADSQTLAIVNYGSAPGTVTSINFEHDLYSFSRSLPFSVDPRQSVNLPLTINTSTAGEIVDTITLTFEDGKTLKAVLHGQVLENAIASLNPTSFSETVNAGEVKDLSLTLSNSGDGDLIYEIIPKYFMYPVEDQAAQTTEVRYVYEEKAVSNFRNLVEVEGALRFDDWSASYETNYQTIIFEEPIRFYGELYDTMYVGLMGWVSFSKPNLTSMLAFPYGAPYVDDMVNGFIAPAAGPLMQYDITVEQDHGVYVYSTEDELIVQWNTLKDIFGMSATAFDFQFILNRNNGRIDFEYNGFLGSRANVLVGVENVGETKGTFAQVGVLPNDGEPFSYSFYPVTEKTLAGNSSIEYTLRADAENLNDGVYSDTIVVHNNTVGNEVLNIPVELTVVGTPVIEVTELDIDTVYYVAGTSVEKDFVIKNTGTKALNFGSATHDGTKTSIEYYYAASAGAYAEGWVDIVDFIGQDVYAEGSYLVGSGKVLEPGESFTFTFTFTPKTLGSGSENYSFYDSEGVLVATVPVSYTVIRPPVFGSSHSEVVISADDATYQKDTVITINNTNGKTPMRWNASMVFNRGTNQITDDQIVDNTKAGALFNVLEAAPIPALKSNAVSTGIDPDVIEMEDYNRIMSYDTIATPSNYLGYGTYYAFQSGTHFVAPEDGFSLSHVRTFYRPESILSGKIKVEVLGGTDNIASATTLAEGTLEYTVDAVDEYGTFFTVELDEEVYIYPEEDFWIMITYPLGVSNPQGCSYIPYVERITGRFFYRYEGLFYDLGSDASFNQYGYMVWAMEEAFNPKYWVALDQTSGTIPVGGTQDITLSFDATFASEVENNADLIIATNDPLNDTVDIPVQLLLNEAPKVTVDYDGVITVTENETLELDFYVNDKEEDQMTFVVLQQYDFVDVTYQASSIHLAIAPGYDDNGVYSLTIMAQDEHGATSLNLFQFKVVDDNRIPFAKEVDMITFDASNLMYMADLTTFVDDLDDEQLTYTYKVKNDGVMEVLISDYTLVLRPREIGTDTISITGTDAMGYSATCEVAIKASAAVGIEVANEAAWEVYPNPTSDQLHVQLENGWGEGAVISVWNLMGQKLDSYEVYSTTDIMTLPVQHLTEGTYFIKVQFGSKQIMKQFVKD